MSSKGSKKKPSTRVDASSVSWGGPSKGKKSQETSQTSEDDTESAYEQSTEPSVIESIMRDHSKFVYGFGGLLVLMFMLFFFVEDSAVAEHRARMREAERARREAHRAANPRKDYEFQYANLMNSSALTQALQSNQAEDSEWDRIILTVFDDSTRDAGGDAKKVKLFRKFESLAKSLPRKRQFKRYEEEELPLVILFDCGNAADVSAEQVCAQLVGTNLPNVVIFRRGVKPRTLSSELRSDNAIASYLFDLMQPPVKYLEELNEVEDFVADDSSMKTMLFGKDAGVFDVVAEALREFGHFGRTQNPTAAESYDIDAPAIAVWATHGTENPIRFSGNMSDAQAVHAFVLNNYLPIFGEFNEQTQKQYVKRGLPIVWVAYSQQSEEDDSEDGLATVALRNSQLFDVSRVAAGQHRGQLSFVKLDVDAQPELARNFGLVTEPKAAKQPSEEDGDEEDAEEVEDEKPQLPQLLIMNQLLQLRENVDSENIPESFRSFLERYYAQLKLQEAARAGVGATGFSAESVQETDVYGVDEFLDDESELEDEDQEKQEI
jgi:hypothetical protein